MLDNPAFLQQMSSMMSNPAVLDQIISMNPQLSAMAPQARQIMQSEQFRQMMYAFSSAYHLLLPGLTSRIAVQIRKLSNR